MCDVDVRVIWLVDSHGRILARTKGTPEKKGFPIAGPL